MVSAVEEQEEQCKILQEDEIEVLESIYPALVLVQPNPNEKPGKLLHLDVPISFSSPISVDLVTTTPNPSTSLPLSHLPSLTLRLHLPSLYPIAAPPRVVSLRAPLGTSSSCDWLSKPTLKAIKDRIGELWAEEAALGGEGAGVIWRFWEWLEHGDFLVDLGIYKNGVVRYAPSASPFYMLTTARLAVPPMIPPSTLHTLLKSHNAKCLHSSFAQTAFSCAICLENRKGKSCIEMPRCVECLQSCWALAITEGSLQSVSCPSVDCTKSRTTKDPSTGLEQEDEINAELVESVVGRDLRVRWETLKVKRKAETGACHTNHTQVFPKPADTSLDPSYTICPLPTCQSAVPPPTPSASTVPASSSSSTRVIRLTTTSTSTPSASASTSTEPSNDRWERYRQCPTCHFSFCLYCSNTWHGPHTPCSFPSTSIIVLEYLSYEEGSAERHTMEMRKGKENLRRMVDKYHEDEGNRKWLSERTRSCAGCGVRVEKSHGCNHMTCNRCHAHFCYRCGASISPSEPYKHYRQPGTPCFERLFDQEEIDRFQRDTEGGIEGFEQWQVGDEVGWREVRGFWEY
ncbi:E3 ubiquitin-protein ligase RNF14, partial [Tremellales sp. Uapishka_1]